MIDDVDLLILDAVQRNGRVRRSELAERTGLSLPAASERLRKLEERGYILGYTAILDARKLGKDVTAFVLVTVDTSRHFDGFLQHVEQHPDILECHAVTGEGSHLLKIRTTDTSALEHVLSEIQSWEEVHRTLTSVVLSSPRETLSISLHGFNNPS